MIHELMIAKAGIKRTLGFPFEICLTRDAARHLIDALSHASAEDFTCGWVSIASIHGTHARPDTEPMPWGDTLATDEQMEALKSSYKRFEERTVKAEETADRLYRTLSEARAEIARLETGLKQQAAVKKVRRKPAPKKRIRK